MNYFISVPEAIDEVKKGNIIILVDDEARENEGDLVVAAENATPEKINFFLKHARGILCLALAPEICSRLSLPLMVQDNSSKFGSAFTVSIDAKAGITTGTSAQDRTTTILTTIKDDATHYDLVRPGHVFPLRAKEGGTLVRAGHTEGSVDLMRLAGLKPAAVICEILSGDGSMARLPELEKMCQRFGLKICSVADIITYRRKTERLIKKVAKAKLPTKYGFFKIHLYRSLIDDYMHLALCAGDVGEDNLIQEAPVLTRVQSECLTGDIFGSLRCDCGEQLAGSLEMISKEGKGVLLYMRQEGRGIGLENKLKAYELQDSQDVDTVEANARLGFPPDLREYGIGAQILYDLGIRKIRLLTNNPKKVIAISGYGLEIVERVPIVVTPSKYNQEYLKIKMEKLGHLINI
jgi:3,4-dihydroxy 2-butanone 4-phosphate synthase/GTP cyclohydrolase II